MVKKWIIAQCDAYFHTAKLMDPLVEHDHIEITMSRQSQRFLPGASARYAIAFFLKDGFHRSAHPPVAESDQSLQFRSSRMAHKTASVLDVWCGSGTVG